MDSIGGAVRETGSRPWAGEFHITSIMLQKIIN
jgi:hypothetical protein